MALEKQIIKGSIAQGTTYDYKPREFNKATTGAIAREYVGEENYRNDFKISDLVAQQTGIAQLESEALQERINNQVLEKVKDIQEKAYQEGYQIGMHDGAERAFQETQVTLVEKMKSLEALVHRVEQLKSQILVDNEAELINLVYLTGKKIALRDLEQNRGAVLEALTSVLHGIKADEKIVVRMSQEDLTFLETLQGKTGQLIESLERAKFVADPSIQSGGCRIESDFGDIVATNEERVERVWTALAEKIPQKSGQE